MERKSMTKSSDNGAAAAGISSGARLRAFAVDKGYEVATAFLREVVKAHNEDPFLQQHKGEMTGGDVNNEMTITYQTMIQTFIMSLLRTVQKTDELIAATGLLTSEGIPWDSENFEPEEIFAEADRLVREAEAQAEGSH
jgi:hypothetical protein